MPGIFDEGRMLQMLEPYVPNGESLSAGIHGITLQVNQKKASRFDVYVGLTDHHLIVVECEDRKYLSELYHVPDLRKTVAQDIGTVFPLSEIQSCQVKNGIMGSVNCSIFMKNGGFLKLMLPKRGGLGQGMPHHEEYRARIIACLRLR